MCRIKEKSISQLDPLVFIDFVSSLTHWYMTVLSWIHHYLLYYLTSYLRDTTVFEFKLMVVPPSLYNGVACTLPSQKDLKRSHFGVFHFVNPTSFGLVRSVCTQFFVFFVVVFYKCDIGHFC